MSSEINTSQADTTPTAHTNVVVESHFAWASCTPCSDANEDCKTSNSETECSKIDPSTCYTDWEEHPGSTHGGTSTSDVHRASAK
ncbi:hypothetical protein I204_03964 [Kwoniella mangroviensis CBS 8886]|nr:hypothetical protein I204_03964 [Kwoniella mangroviensis CBS 8886]